MAKPNLKFTRDEKVLLALMSALQFSNIVDFMILMPLGAQLMRIFDISPGQFGLLVSAYTFSAAISSLLGVVFLDRFDRKSALMGLGVGFVVGTLMCAVASNFYWLLIARAVAGFFGGMLGSCVLSIVSDAVPFERRGTALGVVMGSFALASVFGVPFSLFIANQFTWHTPFFVLAIASAVALAAIFWIMPSMRGHFATERRPWWESFGRVLASRDQMLALFFLFCLVMGQFTIIPYISPSLVANAGMTEAQLPLIYICGGIASFFASPGVGRLSDLRGKVAVFRWSVLFSLVPILWITNLGVSPLPLILLSAVLLFTAMAGRMVPAMALISETTDPQHRGSFMSFVSSVQQLSAALASLLAASIVVKADDGHLMHFNWVGWVAVGFSLITLLLIGNFRKTNGKSSNTVHTEAV